MHSFKTCYQQSYFVKFNLTNNIYSTYLYSIDRFYVGQNIAMGQSEWKAAIDMWYSEVKWMTNEIVKKSQ